MSYYLLCSYPMVHGVYLLARWEFNPVKLVVTPTSPRYIKNPVITPPSSRALFLFGLGPASISSGGTTLGRGDDTVGNPHRAQMYQFELAILLKLDVEFSIERSEPTVSQSTVPEDKDVQVLCASIDEAVCGAHAARKLTLPAACQTQFQSLTPPLEPPSI